jgi:hypothetical protein
MTAEIRGRQAERPPYNPKMRLGNELPRCLFASSVVVGQALRLPNQKIRRSSNSPDNRIRRQISTALLVIPTVRGGISHCYPRFLAGARDSERYLDFARHDKISPLQLRYALHKGFGLIDRRYRRT